VAHVVTGRGRGERRRGGGGGGKEGQLMQNESPELFDSLSFISV